MEQATSVCGMWQIVDMGSIVAGRAESRKQKAEQWIMKKKGIRMALGEGEGLICGMSAKKVGPYCYRQCITEFGPVIKFGKTHWPHPDE